MSLRALGYRMYKHGTLAIRYFTARNYNSTTITEQAKSVKGTGAVANIKSQVRYYGLRNVGVQVGQHARRIFVDNVLNRVTNSLSGELRKRASRK